MTIHRSRDGRKLEIFRFAWMIALALLIVSAEFVLAGPTDLQHWTPDDLITHEFDLALDNPWLVSRGAKIHATFSADGTEIEDDADKGVSVHHVNRWKINGTDLEIDNDQGVQVNLWRLVGRDTAKGIFTIGLVAPDKYGQGRVQREFRVSLKPPYAEVVPDTYAPPDDGGSLPLLEVAATPIAPGASHFEMFGDVIYLTFPVEGHPLRFAIDTGSFGSLITTEAAARLIDANRSTRLGIGGYGPKVTESSMWTKQVKLELPGVTCRHSVLVTPLKMDPNTPRFDGLLGMDILAQLRVRIDYLTQTIEFFPPGQGTVPHVRGFVVFSKRSIHVPVSMLSLPGAPLAGSMFIDTGANGALIVQGEADRLPRYIIKETSAEGIGGREKAHIARLTSFQIAGRTIPATLADFREERPVPGAKILGGVGGVGGGILRLFRVTLDLPYNRFYMEPYATADNPVLPAVTPQKESVPDIAALTAKAQAGDAPAQAELALAYLEGKGVSQDSEKAHDWLQKAADQNNARAQYGLGLLYVTGSGVPKDEAQAASWFRKSAEQNYGDGEAALGLAYMCGVGVVKDYAQALTWLQKGVAQNSAKAESDLAYLYEQGLGVQQDNAQALALYEKAALQNDPGAQMNLGLYYGSGVGLAQDYTQAAAWLQKSADQDDAKAQFNLGTFYDYGLGVAKDHEQAVAWYKKSASQGNADAQETLKRLRVE